MSPPVHEPDGAADRDRQDRLERLYDEARHLPEGERTAFLDERCADDPSLRTELESLLADAAEAEEFIAALGRMGRPQPDSGVVERLNAALEGRYRIEREIGRGGMATVFLARDLRHERQVALKVLRPELAAVIGAERFLAEIRTTARLQHPHILPLHDSGEADGLLFFVTPYVEGESLRARLGRERQLPVDEAVAIAAQVAGALEYAHEVGIVHRDIKPANILLSRGQAVVADFGIALALSAAGGGRLTETGLSLGSPHYMSPEQAAAEPDITGRSDLYSLGAVLYEMLAGDPPHTGPTAQAVLSRVLTGTPRPIETVRPSVLPNVASVVARSLEKLPADRFGGAADFAAALEDSSFRWPPDAGRRSSRSWKLGFAAGVALGVVATAAVLQAVRGSGAAAGAPPVAGSFLLPEGRILDLDSDPTLALSPDGRRIVYAAQEGGVRRLYVRDLGAFEARVLEGTEGGTGPFFSPDGGALGFFKDGALRRLPVTGGIVSHIADVTEPPQGASWGVDGTIIFARDSSVWRVSAVGGPLREIPLILDTVGFGGTPDRPVPANLNSTRWPTFLPGVDRALVVTSWPETIGRIDLTNGRFRPIITGDRPTFLPTGHLVYSIQANQPRVNVVPFDLQRLEVTLPPIPVVDDLIRPAGSRHRFAVSRSGVLVWPPGGSDRTIVLVDRHGVEVDRFEDLRPRSYRFPRISPDGRYVGVSDDTENNVWVVDLLQRSIQPVTTDGYNLTSVWSPDGDRLAFNRQAPGSGRFCNVWVPWPGGGEPTPIRCGAAGRGLQNWHRTDELLGGPGIMRVDIETGRETPWIATSANVRRARVSPDGDWVAFESDPTGTYEVYVRPYGGEPPSIPISRGGGVEARWAADGGEILYRNGNTIMAVRVRTTPSFEVLGPPAALFTQPYDFSSGSNWDVLPDGRFLMIANSPNFAQEVRFLLDWLGEFTEGASAGPGRR